MKKRMTEPTSEEKPTRFGRVKAVLVGLAILLVVGLWFGLPVYNEYSWSDGKKKEMKALGWSSVYDQGHTELILPWTWFWPPVRSIWFVNKPEIKRKGGYILVPVVHSTIDENMKLTEQTYVDVIDEATKKVALVDKTSAQEFDFATAKWTAYAPGTPGDAIVQAAITSR